MFIFINKIKIFQRPKVQIVIMQLIKITTKSQELWYRSMAYLNCLFHRNTHLAFICINVHFNFQNDTLCSDFETNLRDNVNKQNTFNSSVKPYFLIRSTHQNMKQILIHFWEKHASICFS